MPGPITGAPIPGILQGAARNRLLVSNLRIISVIAIFPLVLLPQRRRLEAALKVALESLGTFMNNWQ
ncbi:MAG: hypothetical protein V1755_13230 [Chloroflexota bacterium]